MPTHNPNNPNDPLLTVKEAAKRLDVNQSTIRRWILKDAIQYVEQGPYRRKFLLQSVVDMQRRIAGAA